MGHCYRCDTVVEPRLSLQWFVKMKPLARPAIEAVKDGRIQFMPERWTKVYLDWMENIRDWCISRQIWWGHRIPVFYCEACRHEWAAKGHPAACPACGSKDSSRTRTCSTRGFRRGCGRSARWAGPRRTRTWRSIIRPTPWLPASEIIFFWVARMIMAGLEFMGDIPFRTVYIHGTVRDDTGRKMSKSLGNSIDPLAIIKDFSADALRFSLIMVTAVGQDVYLAKEKFEMGRNFLTKLWNAARFMQMHTKDIPGPSRKRSPLIPTCLRRTTSTSWPACTIRLPPARRIWNGAGLTIWPKPCMSSCGTSSATGTSNMPRSGSMRKILPGARRPCRSCIMSLPTP